MDNKVVVGVSHGDINGISYELIIKTFADNRVTELCTSVLFGSPKVVAYYRNALGIEESNFNSIQKECEIDNRHVNILNSVGDDVKVETGQITQEANEFAMLALKRALDSWDDRGINVLVSAPMSIQAYAPYKNAVQFLTERYESKNVVPMLVGTNIKMSCVTHDISLKDVADSISQKNIVDALFTLNRSLKNDFSLTKPRIAVLGVNPYFNNSEELGNEEREIIIPAIEEARSKGIMAIGPFEADKFFNSSDYAKFDIVLAMHHEQAMLPFKMLEGNTGVVLYAGLPIVYTTTVHGVAYDIAGKGNADESALRNAMYLALDVYRNRTMNRELSKNKLRSYNISANSKESDMNVDKIEGLDKE